MNRDRPLAARTRLFAVVVLTAAITAAPGAGAAPSMTTPATATATTPSALSSVAPITWGMAPSGPHGPDGRGSFDYTLDAGAVLTDFVAVSNFGDRPLALEVYAGDAVNTADGGFDLRPAVDEPVDVGAWVTLNDRTLTVPPKSRLDVPFRIEVPADATPGDHVGGIVASVTGTAAADSGQVLVDRRVGTRIYLRVMGDLAPQLAVDDLQVRHDGTLNPFGTGTVTSTFIVRNTGNVRLAGLPFMEVDTPLGSSDVGRSDSTVSVAELLPGGELRVIVHSDGVRPWLRLAVTAGVAADGAGRAQAASTLWVVPWAAVWALLLAAVVVAVRWWLRRRGHRAEAELADRLAAAREQGRAEAAQATGGSR